MVTRFLERSEIDQMLAQAAAEHGYSFDELRRMAVNGTLLEPDLRDLWLIWASEPLAFSVDSDD